MKQRRLERRDSQEGWSHRLECPAQEKGGFETDLGVGRTMRVTLSFQARVLQGFVCAIACGPCECQQLLVSFGGLGSKTKGLGNLSKRPRVCT